jgi:hypothetical protein
MKASSDLGDSAAPSREFARGPKSNEIAMEADRGPLDLEALCQFWDAMLRQLKAFAEAAEPRTEPTADATGDSMAPIVEPSEPDQA